MNHIKRYLPFTTCRSSYAAGRAGITHTPESCRLCWAGGVLKNWRKRIKQLGAG